MVTFFKNNEWQFRSIAHMVRTFQYTKSRNKKLTARSVAIGTVVSYVLDLVGVAATFVLPGGVWIC